MRKSSARKTAKRRTTKTAEPGSPAEHPETSRRELLGRARYWALGLGIVGGGGFFVARAVSGTVHERDLSRVGNGTPTVVQVHDPQCSLCRSLQKETKSALKRFDRGDLNYVVANIRTAKGADFARKHNVPHVTLLLFSADGTLQDVLQGQYAEDELEAAFGTLLAG